MAAKLLIDLRNNTQSQRIDGNKISNIPRQDHSNDSILSLQEFRIYDAEVTPKVKTYIRCKLERSWFMGAIIKRCQMM